MTTALDDDPETSGASLRASVPARIGLLGNPSDGYGGRVIGATIADFAATVVGAPAEAWTVVDGTGREHELGDVSRPDQRTLTEGALTEGVFTEGAELLAAALVRLAASDAWPDDVAPLRLSFATTVPRQVGLSGSSALILAAQLVLLDHAGLEVDDAERARLALETETTVLGWAAGPQDRVVQSLGGVLDMNFARGWVPTDWHRLEADRLPPLVLAWDPSPGSSSTVVHTDVRARFAAGDEQVVQTMEAFAELASRGRRALDDDRAPQIWPSLLRDAFDLRTRFWHLTETDRALVDLATEHDIGASLAGSGGAIVGAATDAATIADFIPAAESIGCRAIVPTIVRANPGAGA